MNKRIATLCDKIGYQPKPKPKKKGTAKQVKRKLRQMNEDIVSRRDTEQATSPTAIKPKKSQKNHKTQTASIPASIPSESNTNTTDTNPAMSPTNDTTENDGDLGMDISDIITPTTMTPTQNKILTETIVAPYIGKAQAVRKNKQKQAEIMRSAKCAKEEGEGGEEEGPYLYIFKRIQAYLYIYIYIYYIHTHC